MLSPSLRKPSKDLFQNEIVLLKFKFNQNTFTLSILRSHFYSFLLNFHSDSCNNCPLFPLSVTSYIAFISFSYYKRLFSRRPHQLSPSLTLASTAHNFTSILLSNIAPP